MEIISTVYHSFNKTVVLDKVMCQLGEDPDQVLFHSILMCLRDGKTTISDWEKLMEQTPSQVDTSAFSSAVHLLPTVE